MTQSELTSLFGKCLLLRSEEGLADAVSEFLEAGKAVIQFAEPTVVAPAAVEISGPRQMQRLPAAPQPSPSARTVPPDVAHEVYGRTSCDGKAHKFHIKTQRCVFCGITYRDARSREPELMVP